MLKSWMRRVRRRASAQRTSRFYRPDLERLECRVNPVVIGYPVSGRVWNDLNADGLQDLANEPGIAGVVVELFRDPDGTPGNADDVSVGTVVTGGNGNYQYHSFDSQQHYVLFSPPLADPPIASTFTAANVGSNDSIDSDAEPTTGRSPHFSFNSSWDFDCGMIGDFPFVNSPPSFNKGPSFTVTEDRVSPTYTFTNWAKNISPGPLNESGQSVTFEVIGNTAPGLFATGPTINSVGTLAMSLVSNANGVATITIRLRDNGGTDNGGVDISPSQSFTITVDPLNDAPAFTKGPNLTVNEDSGPFSQSGWATNISAGPPDEAGQSVSFEITGNTAPGLFAAGPAISPDGTLTFTPAAHAYGTATIALRARDDGGTANSGQDVSATQSFTITVNPITVNPLNDAPAFTKGPNLTVNEDSGLFSQSAWATNISAGPPDEAGQSVSFEITGNTAPGLFAAGPAISPDGTLTFTPAANAYGTATIVIRARDDGGTANGGQDVSATQSFTITVNPINDAPSFVKGPNRTVNEDSGPFSQSAWATNISAGPPDEAGQNVSFEITGNTAPGLFAVGPAISPDGTLTFTPAAEAYGTATIALRARDDGGTANGGQDVSTTQSFTITINPITVNPINDAPSFVKGPNRTVNEDSGPFSQSGWATNISTGPPDEAGQSVSFEITGNTAPGLFAAGPAISPDGTLTFTPAAHAYGTATITLRARDDGGTANGGQDVSTTQSFTITVNPINDAPSFVKGPNLTVNEDSGPFSQSGWATNISAGPPDEAGQSVSFEITGNTAPGLFAAGPAISPDGTLAFTPAADTYGTATIVIRARDDGGAANGGQDVSATQSFTITVNPANEAPSFTKGPDVVLNEDSGGTFTGWATNISTGSPDEHQSLAFEIVHNSNTSLFSYPNGPMVSSSGHLFLPLATNAFGSATITIRLRDNGGTANGGQDVSAPQTFTVTVNSVNDAPSFTRGPEDFTVRENSGPFSHDWATDIRTGPDPDPQTASFEVTSNSNPDLFLVAPAVSPTGTLTFTPAPGAFGSAHVLVRLRDNGGTENGGVDISSAQSINIAIRPTLTVVGAGDGNDPTVHLYSANGTPYDGILAYLDKPDQIQGGVRVATGDIDGDGVVDIITAPGPGRVAMVNIYVGTNRSLLTSFRAFPRSYKGGVYVAAGNFDADPAQEVVVGRGQDVGRVKIFDYDGNNGQVKLLPGLLGNFVAYDHAGVRVAASNFDGLGLDEIITGRAQGSPRVKVFRSDGPGPDGYAWSVLASFLAYGASNDGVFVAAADLDHDGFGEIITGGIKGGLGTVKLFRGGNAAFYGSFVAYDSSHSVRVGVADLDADGKADTILTAPGAGSLGTLIKRFDALTLEQVDEFFAYSPNGGAFVAG